jgi:GntR family transcriptional regulator, transcriptional repressor for pyruvate dehydrogenase complex
VRVTDQPGGSRPFAPARRLRAIDDVSLQIRNAILTGEIVEGDRLPNERHLAEQFEVGRPTVREALRSLEALGIVEIRTGRTGGVYAARPSEATLGSALSTLISLRGASAQELAEFRLSFEADNAWWAARRADADDVAALELLVTETRRLLKDIADEWTPLTEADARWHEALARATKNRLRIGIALGLHEPRLRQAPALGEAHARCARTIPTALAKITRAVKAHNADQARSAMLDHIEQWTRLNPDVSNLDPTAMRAGLEASGLGS